MRLGRALARQVSRGAAGRSKSSGVHERADARALLQRLQRTYGNRRVQRWLLGLSGQGGEVASEVASEQRGATVQRSCCAGEPEGTSEPLPAPAKELGEADPENEAMDKPDPRAGGAATIQCDGKGGYELLLNGWDSATCGTRDCVVAHETSHMKDWKATWPDGCKGQAQGYLPKGDPPDKPLMTVAEYNAFLKKSECTAHTVDLSCAEKLPQEGACKKTVEDYIDLTKKQKAKWC